MSSKKNDTLLQDRMTSYLKALLRIPQAEKESDFVLVNMAAEITDPTPTMLSNEDVECMRVMFPNLHEKVVLWASEEAVYIFEDVLYKRSCIIVLPRKFSSTKLSLIPAERLSAFLFDIESNFISHFNIHSWSIRMDKSDRRVGDWFHAKVRVHPKVLHVLRKRRAPLV